MNKIYDIPFLGDILYLARTQNSNVRLPFKIRSLLPAPVEPWSFWSSYLYNFQWERGGTTPPRNPTKEDLLPGEALRIKQAVQAVCYYQNKKRFLSKYTDFPRIEYLSEVFPDAIFIHIVRDGRAVAASYLEKIESGEFGTWDERAWWIKGWPESWRDEWVNTYNTPLGFVAFQWKFFVGEILVAAKTLGKNRYITVHYKDIVANPHATFNRIFEFCELGKSNRVDRYLEKTKLSNMDHKWKNRFTDEERENLSRIITGPGSIQ